MYMYNIDSQILTCYDNEIGLRFMLTLLLLFNDKTCLDMPEGWKMASKKPRFLVFFKPKKTEKSKI